MKSIRNLNLCSVKYQCYCLLIIWILAFSGSSLSAQEATNANYLKDDFEISLPPLQTLIDSALKKNPYVRFRDLQIKVNNYKLNSERSHWTNILGFQSDMRYGTFDNFSTNTNGGQVPSTIATRNNQLNYGVGAYIKFPLSEFTDRKNLVNTAKTEIEQAKSMAEVQRQELRQLVIRQYNDLILKTKLLKIKSKYLETSHISIEMAEKEFKNGILSVAEYSRIAETVNIAETDYQTVYAELITAYMILEEIVGFRLNLKIP